MLPLPPRPFGLYQPLTLVARPRSAVGHKVQNLEGNGTGQGLLPGRRDTEEAKEGQRGSLRVSLRWDHLTEHLQIGTLRPRVCQKFSRSPKSRLRARPEVQPGAQHGGQESSVGGEVHRPPSPPPGSRGHLGLPSGEAKALNTGA